MEQKKASMVPEIYLAKLESLNIAIHEYHSIDWEIVWAIRTEIMKNFKDFQKAQLALIP